MKRDLLLALVAIVVVAGICWALTTVRPLPPLAAATASGSTSIKGSTAGGATSPAGKVVIKVNGEPLTERELALMLADVPEQAQQVYQTAAGKSQLVQDVVRLMVLDESGRNAGAAKDPEVAARLRIATAKLNAAYAMQKGVAEPTDSAIRAEFEKNRDKLETVELSHILIAIEGGRVPPRDGKVPSPEEAKMRAYKVLEALQQGADFGAVARQVSDDTQSAQQGGMLGPVGHGMLPPELDRVVFQLKPGQVSPPLRSAFGLHIFKAGARHVESFDQVKPYIVQKLKQEAATEQVAAAARNAKVELDPQFFPGVTWPPAAPAAGQKSVMSGTPEGATATSAPRAQR